MANNRTSIYSALAANILIAATKFIAGAFTNSSSMISEGIHSVVDTTNQILLLYGINRSHKPPDASHPFGYGKELYFWSFIVSIMIFGLGGGLSIYQGIMHISHPEQMGDPTWNYVVLGASFVFEGTSLIVAAKAFNKVRGELSWYEAIVKSKDPSSFLVLFEDGAAVVGLLIVFILMVCSHTFDIPWLDGLASILVGILLVFASIILERESRSLLLGEGIAPETRKRIIEMTEKDEAVLKVTNVLSTYQSPDEVVLMLIVIFHDELETDEINAAIERIRKRIKTEYKLIEFVFVQPQALSSAALKQQ
jgi:cation diffusion facilitator family transporter